MLTDTWTNYPLTCKCVQYTNTTTKKLKKGLYDAIFSTSVRKFLTPVFTTAKKKLTSVWFYTITDAFQVITFNLPLLFKVSHLLWAFISYKFIEIAEEKNTMVLDDDQSVMHIKRSKK
jgi:hypothetical protein